jgi:hypothetical protein
MTVGSASAAPPPWPKGWPAELAPFAQVLTGHRGVAPSDVQDRSAGSSQATAFVTDAHGSYQASLAPLNGLPAHLPPGATLSQVVRTPTVTTRTVWTVRTDTNQVVWGPQTTTEPTDEGHILVLGQGAPKGWQTVNQALAATNNDPNLRQFLIEQGYLPPDVPQAALRHGNSHHVVLTAINLLDYCADDPTAPQTVFFWEWWLQGLNRIYCTIGPTNIINGVNEDEAFLDEHWHAIGQPGSNGGVNDVTAQVDHPCLAADLWSFRTRGYGIVEFLGITDGGEVLSYATKRPCQEYIYFTGIVP